MVRADKQQVSRLAYALGLDAGSLDVFCQVGVVADWVATAKYIPADYCFVTATGHTPAIAVARLVSKVKDDPTFYQENIRTMAK